MFLEHTIFFIIVYDRAVLIVRLNVCDFPVWAKLHEYLFETCYSNIYLFKFGEKNLVSDMLLQKVNDVILDAK